MLRLALGNAPVKTCSQRALSSIVTRRPAQWTRTKRFNSTKAGAGAVKKGEKLSSESAVRVEAPAKPTVSSQGASKAVPAGEKAASLESKPSSSEAPTVTVTEGKAAPTSKIADPKPTADSSVLTPKSQVATKSTPSNPVAAAEEAAASLEASVPPTVKLETKLDSTGLASSRVEASSTAPVSDLPPVQAEAAIEAFAVESSQTSPKDAQVIEEVEQHDEDEDFDFANIDTSVEEATVKLLQSEEFIGTLQSGSEPQGPLETPDFGGLASTPEQNSTPRLRTREELGDNFSEAEWHSAIVHGRGVHLPFRHPRTHSVPAALIHFRSHSPEHLALFTHFAQHAAASLGIPCSGVASLPTKRTLWTVIKGPFVHKKTQENFERRVHKRAIKVWDAHPEVVDLWTSYLRRHAMGGVGMRVVKWTRAPVGVGQQVMERVKKRMGKEDKVRKMGEQIIQAEMRKDMPAVEQ